MSRYTRREEEKLEIYRELTRYAQQVARREAAQAELIQGVLPDRLYNVIYGTEGLGLIGDTANLDHVDLDKWLWMEAIVSFTQARLPSHRIRALLILRDIIAANVVARSRTRAAIFPQLPGELDRVYREEKQKALQQIAEEKGEE